MMKSINNKLILAFLIVLTVVSACKKDKTVVKVEDTITAGEYVYNTATKAVTPNANITANIVSTVGIKFIYSYLVRTGKPDSLINVAYPTVEEQKNYTLTIPGNSFDAINMDGTTAIKSVTKRLDNSSDESIIKLTSFTPPLPVLEDFPASKLPDSEDKIVVTGKASSKTGLDKIEILDDSQGDFTIVTTIPALSGAKTYDVNYTYTYRANTANLKIIAYDTFGITTAVVISVPALPFTLYKDIEMGAQGNATSTITNNHFFIASGTTGGGCTVLADENALDFLYYGTSSGPAFYSPTNATNVAKNFYCNGTKDFWNTSTTDFSKLKPTRFRVLVPGDTGVDAIYAKFAANDISDLDDTGFFTGVSLPSSSSNKYVGGATPTTTQFDITTAYLIWARVPTTPAATAYKNCLIRVNEAVDASTTSTIKFDIYVQK